MTLKTGDRVAYSANWLRSTGQIASADDIGGWRGTVTGLVTHGSAFTLAQVQWDRTGRSRHAPTEPKMINVKNLARVGTAAMSAN